MTAVNKEQKTFSRQAEFQRCPV